MTKGLMKLLVVCFALFMGGCASLMVDAKSPLTDKPSTARVYFALDQFMPQGRGYITDGTKLLGAISNGKHFVADLEPGEHTIMLISEQDEAIKANLEAGKSYYVRVFVTPGVMSTRTYWTPLKDTAEDKKLREEMIANTDRLELVPEEAAKWEADEAEELKERLHSFKTGEDEIKQTLGEENAI